MLSHCLKCRKNMESKNARIEKIKTRKTKLLSNCGVCRGKKLRFIAEQEINDLLTVLLGVKLTFE